MGFGGALLSLALGLLAIIVCARQGTGQPLIPHLLDINFTQYSGLYCCLVFLFVPVIELYHIRLGENSTLTMSARAVIFVFLSLYMFLSLETLFVGVYFAAIVAPLQIYYEKSQVPNGFVTLEATK